MDRLAEFMNSLVMPERLRGPIRNYIVYKRSGYQEIGAEPETSWWIKLIIYLGATIAVILSIVAFCYGYVVIPAISTSVAVICAVLFWFRNSIAWINIIGWFRTVCCFPCNYFKKSPSPDAWVKYERRLRELLFSRSCEANAEVEAEAPNLPSEASSDYEASIVIDQKPVQESNVAEH